MKKNLLHVALVLSIITAMVTGASASAAPSKSTTTLSPSTGTVVTFGVGANDWGN
ncbi:hypothetical protein [Deinococcus pimensis]|uniref:hypothetical protein n=1 Tax=Deinococcus pimensis TaxID=309888 RepID=UPI0004B1EB6F|nr:hypothetical protein [Deinococcus pimensis]